MDDYLADLVTAYVEDPVQEMNRHLADGDVPGFLAALRRVLAERLELELDHYADFLDCSGATAEEAARTLALHRERWADSCDRKVREVEAFIQRGGRALQ